MVWLAWIVCDVLVPIALVSLGYRARAAGTGAAVWGALVIGVALSISCSLLLSGHRPRITVRFRETRRASRAHEQEPCGKT